MSDRGCQLPHRRDPISVRQRYLGLAQGFGGEHMLGEVAADHECGLYPFRVWPQGRVSHREVAPAVKSKVEPCRIIDFLSCEAPVVIRLSPLESVRPYE